MFSREMSEKETVARVLMGPQWVRTNHGSLFDRGSADSYYGRPASAHWYPNGTYKSDPVTELTDEEVAEYQAGYDWNERYGDKKDWG